MNIVMSADVVEDWSVTETVEGAEVWDLLSHQQR